MILLGHVFVPVNAQVQQLDYSNIEINIDSIIQDSLSKAFILNHKPLTANEKSAVVFKKEKSIYGEYINYYLEHSGFYSLATPQGALFSPNRVRPKLEWIFYSFLFLFLFTAALGRYSNGLLRKLWKIYVNDGFIHRQSKDQMSQVPLISTALNLLFVFSSGLFLFFGFGWDHLFLGNSRWLILIASFFIIAAIYIFKYVFFNLLGWAFNQQEAFRDYLFVVFLNNKLLGLIFLFSSFLLAFSSTTASLFIFRLTFFIIVLMFLYRILRGYQAFSKQKQSGFFTLTVAFFALEFIPTAVIVKFLDKTIDLFITGIS